MTRSRSRSTAAGPLIDVRENLMLHVLPAAQCSTLFSLATERSSAVGPLRSAPWQAPTPSASVAPARRPSGVAPVQWPECTCPSTGHTPQV